MRVAATHLLIWIIWYSLNGFALFNSINELTTTQWYQVAYNLLSLVFVFYLTSFFATRWFKLISGPILLSKPLIGKIKYLAKWPALVIFLITAGYIATSIILDNYIFGYKYPTLFSHIDQRWTRVSMYSMVAVGYSLYRYQMAWHEKRHEVNRARVIEMKDGYTAAKDKSKEVDAIQRTVESEAKP